MRSSRLGSSARSPARCSLRLAGSQISFDAADVQRLVFTEGDKDPAADHDWGVGWMDVAKAGAIVTALMAVLVLVGVGTVPLTSLASQFRLL